MMDITELAEDLGFAEDTEDVRFSYSRPEQHWLKRGVIRGIEMATGQPMLERMYREWAANPPEGENIFAAGIRLLDVSLKLNEGGLERIPREGPLLVIANHPYGVIDGMALGAMITKVRPDTKIMTHSLLCQPPQAKPYLLPVDFGGTPEARATSVLTRKRTLEWLAAGHCVAMFPAGGVSSRQNPFAGIALDSAWYPFTAKLAKAPKLSILPVFFHGQNSTLFHLATHLYYPFRVALMFRESVKRIGSELKATIGAPVRSEDLPHMQGRDAVLQALRQHVYGLSGFDHPALHRDFAWPSHVSTN
jgi:putative hemolysin